MKIVKVDINELICPEYNPRQITDEEMEKLKNSINEFGYVAPIIVNKHNNHIIGGNQRYEALKSLGYTDVDVVFVDEPNLNREKALNLALNKISGEWDFIKLADILDDLELNDFDISLTGFDDLELENFGIEDPKEQEPVEVVEDDYEEPDELEVTVQTGDIYVLGNHRLMCGDSTKIDDVEKLMNGKKADMVFTDPPYNVAYTGGMKKENSKLKSNNRNMIKNDKMDEDTFYNFLYNVYINLKLNTKEKSAIYVFYAHSMTRQFISSFQDAGLKQRSIIIWHKTSGGFGDFMAQYMNAYEPCIYGSNGETVNWYGPNNEKTVWNMDKEKKCDLHPTMKPLELVGRAIKNSSKENDIVLDLFGGSGSTLISCEQLNRNCYMMELDPKYCQVIINRWEEFTGEKAEKIGGA